MFAFLDDNVSASVVADDAGLFLIDFGWVISS